MEYSDMIIFAMEIVGTIAFAVSGAMIAIQRRMDLFGVNVLGVTTATGGGLIRDLILGMNPPAMFRNSKYALTAVVTSTVVFFFVYLKERQQRRMREQWRKEGGSPDPSSVRSWIPQIFRKWYHAHEMYERLLFLGDTIGLGIFTVMGSYTAVKAGFGENRFLLVFVGVMTGVGGGLMRDVMAGNMPYILMKHVYAVASLGGALVYTLLRPYIGNLPCMMTGAAAVMTIRFLAAHYRWNLPRV
ncbi:MAG: TRIC cation channel family protein [Lachnospiraceae bacterium]|nr:TRIC cation channel family protein [Lachnospiraceae bacterium]MDD7077568.1 TRIC cation channel family protein [Lachnospiraceae bacterium]MDY3730785.1 TRIC cation channel family protein [Candidatus Choladocola sp.]